MGRNPLRWAPKHKPTTSPISGDSRLRYWLCPSLIERPSLRGGRLSRYSGLSHYCNRAW
jgi:hypothetical protein